MTPKSAGIESVLFQIKIMPPVNKWDWPRIYPKQHNPYKSQASSASCIAPINSHTSYFGKSIGPNKRTVPNNRTVSSKWNQRVFFIPQHTAIRIEISLRGAYMNGNESTCALCPTFQSLYDAIKLKPNPYLKYLHSHQHLLYGW